MQGGVVSDSLALNYTAVLQLVPIASSLLTWQEDARQILQAFGAASRPPPQALLALESSLIAASPWQKPLRKAAKAEPAPAQCSLPGFMCNSNSRVTAVAAGAAGLTVADAKGARSGSTAALGHLFSLPWLAAADVSRANLQGHLPRLSEAGTPPQLVRPFARCPFFNCALGVQAQPPLRCIAHR